MNITWPRAVAGALIGLASLGTAYAAGYAAEENAAIEVVIVHEESGEVADLTVLKDGKPVPSVELHEQWRGNDDSPTGLYDYDPAPASASTDPTITTES